jgi:hypothetical protein
MSSSITEESKLARSMRGEVRSSIRQSVEVMLVVVEQSTYKHPTNGASRSTARTENT